MWAGGGSVNPDEAPVDFVDPFIVGQKNATSKNWPNRDAPTDLFASDSDDFLDLERAEHDCHHGDRVGEIAEDGTQVWQSFRD
jgi:hypothetical protein